MAQPDHQFRTVNPVHQLAAVKGVHGPAHRLAIGSDDLKAVHTPPKGSVPHRRDQPMHRHQIDHRRPSTPRRLDHTFHHLAVVGVADGHAEQIAFRGPRCRRRDHYQAPLRETTAGTVSSRIRTSVQNPRVSM